ncbi:LacI family DNA-binding transcriptional regulator [Chelatococcus asaccharovorans]|uniref:LacI family DNA-binding transcriptional regulator n=2 Tax=Chelatococcus asaccharovorans TaxID=28210 RepID=UPI00224C6A3C|nr:LacI family DNA-binding transcriptional regulator [Chelatococcus asaccharovorans]CAH1657990.1 LacI family gluconate utilization system Gnt-I transcriptional repressor [Chelatococcus asaccharovorans]CAH1688905.1 LacI family gluconate utilization system Gnt-I transcriptional repressor [Chelatococcus asaccharovorans]
MGMENVSGSSGRRVKRAGIRDVARLAGVAPMTVSRALSFPHRVSVETREKIAAAIAATGYIPNRVASNLSSNQTMTIGAVIPTLRNSIAADFTEGFSRALKARGYHLLLGNSDFIPEGEETIVAEFLARRVDGVYLTGATHTAKTRKMLRDNAIPTVEIASLPEDPIDMAVGFSNFDAAYEVTRMLAEQGYRRVALFTTFTKDNERQVERQAGYRAAVRDFGLDTDPRFVAELEMDLKAAGRQLRVLVGERPDVDALFCTGDFIAAGALFEAQRLGIRVPDDLAIAGFEGLEIAENLNPSLTTVRIPRFEIGSRAGTMLLDRIAGKDVEQRVVDMGFEIIKRGSTATPATLRRETAS